MISKIANWIVWSLLTVLIVVLVYRYTDWLKPAVDKGVESVKSVVAKTPIGPFGKDTSAEQLNSARDAFANGNTDASITAYQAYLKLNPDNADARGELGNVYYLTGKLPEAAQAYYDAGKLLIAQKHPERVPALLPIIGQVNPALADELAQKLAQAAPVEAQTQAANDDQPAQQPTQSATRYY
jgi:cytochrome c-type biogenesis protein CcmH/NrfG